MSAQHTPGPWMVRSYDSSSVGTKDYMTAIIYGENREEETANANLIAAAPDLLEALETLENDDNSIPSFAWDMVQSAIAKAKGETK